MGRSKIYNVNMIYNFRFDRNHRDKILKRIKAENLLCQGWGGGKEGKLNMAVEDTWKYRTNVRDYYKLPSTRIPSNLSHIRNFRDGDLLVVPHLPKNGKVSIFIVDGDFPDCYNYHKSDTYHLNNQIKIKKCCYGLEGNIHIHNASLAPWYGKLQWMRLPILPMEQHKSLFVEICAKIDQSPSTEYKPSEIDEYFDRVTEEIFPVIRERLENISPNTSQISFEKVCEYLVKQQGYDIKGRNSYDGKGGDVDLQCVRNRSNISSFESGEDKLFIQIKKHSGDTNEKPVNQLIKMMKKDPDAHGCVMSLAENYTREARKLADINGILLLNGKSILTLLLQALGERLTIENHDKS